MSLSAIANRNDNTAKQEIAIQECLNRSWTLVVGTVLVHQTRLIRVHRGTMLIGCWHYDIINSLRQSAMVAWPKIQDRILNLWKIKLHSVEIVPCDPPVHLEGYSQICNNKETDRFLDVLNILRKQHKS